MKRTLLGVWGLGLIVLAGAALRAQVGVPGRVVSVFAKNCLDCHKGKFPPQGLSWEEKKIEAAVGAPSRERPELKIIDLDAPDSSYVLKKVRGEAGIKGSRMPPSHELSTDDIKVLEDWIRSLKKVAGPGSI